MKVVIVGPTGVGKTKLSIELAKYLDAYIINADAVQVYKDLNIGSAKIKEEEKEGIKHFLLDIKEPNEEYSVKDYQEDVRKIFDDYKDKNFVLVGGTGLYICGALMDYRFYEEESSKDFSNLTNDELYELVLEKDKDTKINKNNRVRMERFLNKENIEVVEPKLLYDDCIFIGLTTDRDKVYERINNRVDEMFKEGLVREVRELYRKYPNSKILKRAIGYKEVIEYIECLKTLEEVKEDIKKNSRHYAKRQYTWFNNKMDVKWFLVSFDNFDKTITDVKTYIDSCHNN